MLIILDYRHTCKFFDKFSFFPITFLLFATVVSLRVDVVINAMGLIFLGTEILFCGMGVLNLFILSRRI
jgi:hypothetical protein